MDGRYTDPNDPVITQMALIKKITPALMTAETSEVEIQVPLKRASHTF